MYEYVKPKQHAKNTPQKTEKKSIIPSALNRFDTGLKPKLSIENYTGPVVQMVRKRVKGNPDSLTADDIYYDKNDGGYYTEITKEADQKEALISNTEFDEYRHTHKDGRSIKTTILAKARQGDDTKYINNITKQVQDPFDPDNLRIKADIFTNGRTVPTPPKTIRLYAEGDMTHALSLSDTICEPGKFDAFKDLDADTSVSETEPPEVLIKATEYDTTEGIITRYGRVLNTPDVQEFTPGQKKQVERYYALGVRHCQEGESLGPCPSKGTSKKFYSYYKQGYEAAARGEAYQPNEALQENVTAKLNDASAKEHLEASFGASTGDLAREGRQFSKRKYDIIQATFFWIPQATNDENFNMLKKFMIFQHRKLKPDGKIKIILSNSSSGSDKSNYDLVATHLNEDSDLISLYDLRLINLQSKYSEKLNSLGMNPRGFKHTATAYDTEVSSTEDIILVGTKKSNSPDEG